MKISSADRILAAALGAGLFFIYALGACRTIYVGDSGELVAAAATLGIPHPSGYPLYVLLGKLWILLLPLGSIAFRMSLFSAFWAAASCHALYLLARRLELATSAALLSALLLAFSPSFWSQANVQRVYSLNAFFVIALATAAVAWYQSRRGIWLVVAGFLAGLGACNHTFIGIMALAVGVFAVITSPAVLRDWKTILASAGATLVGLLPYAYLPIRSRQNPRLDWGNPETFESFRAVVMRHDFWDRAWLESPADFLVIGGDYLLSLGQELAWVGTALALVGLVAGWVAGRHKGWPVLLPLVVMAANFGVMGLHGSRSDLFIWHRYYIPSYIMAALLAGCGWQWFIERQWVIESPNPPGALRAVRKTLRALRVGLRPVLGRQADLGHGLSGGAAWAVLVVPLVMLLVGYRAMDRSRFRIAEDFSRTLVESLPPGAHLSASDDNILFVLIYLTMVENVRPDLDLILQGVGSANLPSLRFDPDTDPLYFTHHPNWNFPGLELAPIGLVFKTVRSPGPKMTPVIPKWQLEGEDDPRVPKDYLTQNLVGHFHYMLALSFEHSDWLKARGEFEKALAAAPGNDVLFYNMGLIYRRNGLLERSLRAFERSEEINPRHIASKSQVRASDRISEVRSEINRLAAIEGELAAKAEMTGLERGSPNFHQRLANLLEARGETAAARGHVLRAIETTGSS